MDSRRSAARNIYRQSRRHDRALDQRPLPLDRASGGQCSGRERYSVPFFFSGNFAHKVECIPTCLAPGDAPKYPPTTVEAHMREMYRKTYKG